MNNKIEVIGIDHGWSNMKTSSQVFTTGVKEITTEPALFDGVLEYKGKYYNTDSSKMAEVIGVSEAQLRFVTNTSSGMGLIKCGSVVIPFDNQISKDTDLYKLYNTNIHEKIAEKKKREALNNGN